MQENWGVAQRWVLAALVSSCAWALLVGEALAAPPQIAKSAASEVTSTSAVLESEINPGGKLTRYHFEYGTSNCVTGPCVSIPVSEAEIPAGSSPVHVEVMLEGLSPGTVYHFLTSARNGEGGIVKSADRIFATHGTPSSGLPDGRAYEQSSPVDKDGGDAVGAAALIRAANDGRAITFQSTFGIPGGKGAGALPTYLGSRSSSAWSTQGLLPPPVFGERTQVQGWLPDFSETVSNASKFGSVRLKALVLQSTTGGQARVISPYTFKAEYSYVGADADASTFFFESPAAISPVEGEDPIEGAIPGRQNLYAWDRTTQRVSLAGVMNDEKAPPKGTLAGPYNWAKGITPQTQREGGAVRGYYLQDTHAITASGGIYFTEAGSAQLYLRLNPTQPQSQMDAGGCTEEAKACTTHVSASKRTIPDPAGTQPAAFAAASTDGSKVFFTSPEKLTNEANTGPDQPAAAIGIGSSSTGTIEEASFIPKRAIGVAVDSEHVYWADPIAGTIGRADIDGGNQEEGFIEVGPSECELETEPGVFEVVSAPASPRYVAVDSGHVYWTNTGLRDNNNESVEKGGTIGRANLDGEAASVTPDFICGASNPQGIAVDAAHIYWANAAKDPVHMAVARAAIDGTEVEQEFFSVNTSTIPYGVALSSSHTYVALSANGVSYIGRVPLAGGPEERVFVGDAGIRGIALDASNIFWANQGSGALGKIPITDFSEGSCGFIVSCDDSFAEDIEGTLSGLAADASHLYWSVNGESPSNPGNDLYRYEPASDSLEDLTPLEGGNGAEVQGVLGTSEDGSHVYFAANGDLDQGGLGTKGDCETQGGHGPLLTTTGSCSIYLMRGTGAEFVARVKGPGDALAWTGTPRELFSTAGYSAKTAVVSKDGEALLFGSQEKLTDYDNEGVTQLYHYSASDGSLACVSCSPSGEAAESAPGWGSIAYPGDLNPSLGGVTMIQSRNLSVDGNRVFFETAEALVPEDTNGQGGCPSGVPQLTPACLDVYEWEAAGTGSCAKGGAAYSVLNDGCLYLISTGKSEFPSLFADASESGGDAFFFTRQPLVGQDKDELQDIYDARVGGGLPAQNPPPPNPCLSTDSCHGPVQTPPSEPSGGSATFVGPGDPLPKHKRQKAKKHKKKNKKSKAKGQQGRAVAKGGQGR